MLEHEAPVDIQQPETSGYQSSLDQLKTLASQPRPGFCFTSGKSVPELTFGTPHQELVSYDLQEVQASGSEADPQEKDRIYTEDQSYGETVRGVRALHGLVVHIGPGMYCLVYFLKVPKLKRQYNLHPAPNLGDTRPGRW